MSAFFDMGGYGAFIWPSYAATVLVLGLTIAFSVSAHARAKAEIRRLEDQTKGGPS
jgi:heme exporter protein CcmD